VKWLKDVAESCKVADISAESIHSILYKCVKGSGCGHNFILKCHLRGVYTCLMVEAR
jgi:hypothetical protein